MRARLPDATGSVDRDGVDVAYEVFGTEGPWVVFSPMDPIIHSRGWKAQVPYLSRYARVCTIDPRGNGASDRPLDPVGYTEQTYADDLVAVMDHLGVERAALAGICGSALWALMAAAQHPERVTAVVVVGSQAPFLWPRPPVRPLFGRPWQEDYPAFLDWFANLLLPEPHSTKQVEDFVSWGMDSPLDVQVATTQGPEVLTSADQVLAILQAVRCPVLAIHGDLDRCQPLACGQRVAELTGGELLVIEGAGHLPMGREPVLVNLAIRDFLQRAGALGGLLEGQPVAQRGVSGDGDAGVVSGPAPQDGEPGTSRRFTTPRNRPRRVLYLSSPIGLGHARRDLAVAQELRAQVPGLEVDWLAQDPVTRFLTEHGERVHPASRWLASESAQFEECAGEHDLNAFQAVRQMDEVLVNNFMVFNDLVERESYDLWTGDEAWDVDYFLHENPDLKRTAYAWLTDFVGWLPMEQDDPGATAQEAALTADYNADMLEQIARLPRIRDHSLFVGNPEDVVDETFGPGLPRIRDWVGEHYDFTGYITGFAADEVADREALRRAFGFGEEPVCVVAVGGSGVGGHLLRRAVEAHRLAARRVDGLRTVIVTGPRIDPESVPRAKGLTVKGYVPDLHRLLAAADVAVVQGGLTTTMELAAAGRPFVYVPLRHHFEQNRHVRHRLDNYGAGTCVTWDEASPDRLAEAVVTNLGTHPACKPVESDGAARAAARLAQLI
jgi:pimeloyl-ACP methyl ester carboxylesterase/predicted glycosyltransferase